MKRLALLSAMVIVTANLAAGQSVPVADYHQHIFSPTIASLLIPLGSRASARLTARDLVTLLDSAGIRRALLLSVAYMYGSPARTVGDEYAKVREENDWTAAQAAEYPDRLRALCSFNPLKEYALQELERCARDPNLRYGIKLHFGNSDVQLDNPEHVERLKRVFRAANDHHMAIIVHLRASVSKKRPYGAAQARVFLQQLLPLVPDIDVQVAHLAGTGPGYDDPPADSAMAVLAEAVEKDDPRTRRLWFDVASVVDTGISAVNAALVVKRIRQVGVERILYGSDAPVGENLRPREGWAAFRRLPLTDDEFKRIASNVTPYLMDSSPAWTPLFNGHDLTGWEHVGPGQFVVENGVLKTEGGMGLLWYSPRKLGHCTLRIVFRTSGREGNSGVFIRVPEKPTEPWMPVNRGYEVQIDESGDEYHVTGVLYSLTKAMARTGRPGEWNEMEIGLDGPRTWVKLNGALVTDYVEGLPTPPKRERWEPDRGPRPEEGYIGLQNHSSGDTVYFKEVSVAPLPSQRPHLPLEVLPDTLAVCRLAADAAVPSWASARSRFVTISRTREELSITAVQSAVPADVQCERDYRAFRVRGPLPLNLIGILAAIADPLARAGLSVFAISTFDTDYVLVKARDLDAAVAALEGAGHGVTR